MSLLSLLASPECWEAFYRYKSALLLPKAQAEALRAFMDRRAYVPVLEGVSRGAAFPLPRRAEISKLHGGKKRVVYIYPEPENTVLKCLTWLLLRNYDGLFSPGLYSFRPGRTAKDAIRQLMTVPRVGELWAYQADISNYFNSVDLERFLPILRQSLGDDPELSDFLCRLLLEPEVLGPRGPLREQKGIMAGTPLSAFYANLFLRDLDASFQARGLPYARYSDDVILLAPSEEACRSMAGELRQALEARGLRLNPEKERISPPGSGWSFLGFHYREGVIDIAPATLEKLKAKMRRKSRALARWRDRDGHSGQQAAAAFIRVFNRKLLEAPQDHELSWSHWFFSVINTDRSLREIDHYAQDCLRFLVSGRRTKARYNVRYQDLKALGYQSLVHAYYAYKKPEPEKNDLPQA